MVRLFAIVALIASLTACASSGIVYTPQPFPMPGGASIAVPAPADPAAPPTTTTAAGPAAVPTPVAAPPPMPGRSAPVIPRPGSADGYALSGTALSLRGAPYRSGGVDPAGFDCSGFVRYVYQQHGVAMPRETREQFRVGKHVDRDRLEAGDLVFFTTTAPGASHVGIMIGGDQFVHAPNEKGVVRVENLGAQYWTSRYIGAKRVN